MYSPFLGELDEKTGMARTYVHLDGGEAISCWCLFLFSSV